MICSTEIVNTSRFLNALARFFVGDLSITRPDFSSAITRLHAPVKGFLEVAWWDVWDQIMAQLNHLAHSTFARNSII